MHIKPADMKFVPKPWGHELWIVNNEKYCGKLLFIKQGKHCSFHHHNEKDEVLYVASGRIRFFKKGPDELWVSNLDLVAGHAYHVQPGVKHQMEALEDTTIYEFSTTHRDEDSVRTTTDLVVSDR